MSRAICLALATLLLSTNGADADSFYYLSIDDVQIDPPIQKLEENKSRVYQSRAILDGSGEIYTHTPSPEHFYLAIRVSHNKAVTGKLFYPSRGAEGQTQHPFKIDPSLSTDKAKRDFFVTKRNHNSKLLQSGVPGGAWFRYQMNEAARSLGNQQQDVNQRTRFSSINQTYDVFSGGAAISDNLRLDRQIRETGSGSKELVALKKIRGVTVREVDWKTLNEGLDPKHDSLAKLVPADQHVIFFKSFDDVLTSLAESDHFLMPTFLSSGWRSEDAGIAARYQKQLCLNVANLGKIGATDLISSVAITGSDPYLDLGTDVALLVESKSPEMVVAFVRAQHEIASADDKGIVADKGVIEGTSYVGVRSRNRSVCSYIATLGNSIVITNSKYQLRQIILTNDKKLKSVGSLPEYTFFRDRYPLDDQETTGLMIMSDAAIRRWCSPRWRIGTSRRLQAVAILSDLQARYADKLLVQKEMKVEETEFARDDLGRVYLQDGNATSSVYGSLAFMKPIAELTDLAMVTRSEADAYNRWRDNYEGNWNRAFDPIAVRLAASNKGVAADITVIPLMVNSEYREMIQFTNGPPIEPTMGDRHKEALVHFLASYETTWGFFPGVTGIELYFDDDPFWQDFVSAEDQEKYVRSRRFKIPAGVQIHNKDKEAANETRARLKQLLALLGKPVEFEDDTFHGQEFTKIHIPDLDDSNDEDDQFTILVSQFGPRILYTLDEDMLRRAIDRQQARAKGDKVEADDRAWLGKNLAIQLNPGALRVIETLYNDHVQTGLRERSWENLTILNEWKRMWPDEDAIDVHRRLFKTTLVCPSQGKYRWNDEWRTMESSVYGHPGQPRYPMSAPSPIANIRQLDLGITFEHGGLRAKIEMKRE